MQTLVELSPEDLEGLKALSKERDKDMQELMLEAIRQFISNSLGETHALPPGFGAWANQNPKPHIEIHPETHLPVVRTGQPGTLFAGMTSEQMATRIHELEMEGEPGFDGYSL